MWGKEPDCNACMPTLMIENIDAANIWLIVRDQVIVAGMNGTIVSLNQLALWKAIDEYKIEKRIECFDKVRQIFAHFLEIERIRNMSSSGDNS